MFDAQYHADQLVKELDGAERAYAGLERQMDKLIYENRDLRREIEELKLEIIRLGGKP
jgi:predicted  nucleic acid-binding Zn-ribbon protein